MDRTVEHRYNRLIAHEPSMNVKEAAIGQFPSGKSPVNLYDDGNAANVIAALFLGQSFLRVDHIQHDGEHLSISLTTTPRLKIKIQHLSKK